MTARVSPTERIRAEIDELIAGAERGSLLEHFEEVARAAVRLVFQTALENEVTDQPQHGVGLAGSAIRPLRSRV